MSLTAEQIWFFRQSGYLKLTDRLSDATIEELKQATYSNIEAEKEI